MRNLLVLAVASIAAGLSSPAYAQLLTFNGNVGASAVVAPNAGCAPIPFQGNATGTGNSNLGSFTYTHTVCTQGATGPVIGNFLANFGLDQFEGTLNGASVATATAGIFDQAFNFAITSGTGRFLGATGDFTSVGQVDATSRPSQITFTFNGLINAPAAVPEPATWATMLIGFGMAGFALRYRRRSVRPGLPQAA